MLCLVPEITSIWLVPNTKRKRSELKTVDWQLDLGLDHDEKREMETKETEIM
jgi:hypothetical protein